LRQRLRPRHQGSRPRVAEAVKIAPQIKPGLLMRPEKDEAEAEAKKFL